MLSRVISYRKMENTMSSTLAKNLRRAAATPLLILSAIGILCTFASPVSAQEDKEKEKPAAKATFVGMEACQTCHEEPRKWLQGSVHQSLLQQTSKAGDAPGCEACHGPGSIHVEEPSKSNILTFRSEPADRRSHACLVCHGKKQGVSDFLRTAHRSRQIACDQCHSRGDSEKFHSMRSTEETWKERDSSLCLECHQEVRASFSMPFRHRVQEGYLRCVDCHTIHGGLRSGKRGNEQNNETCARCHMEKSGPFLYEHIPGRVGGCLSCHLPHGSTNPKMLIRNTVHMLCLECHNDLPTLHNLSQERYRRCTTCHPAIHGSNQSRKFTE